MQITIASNAREIVSLQLSGQQLTVVAEIAAKSEVSCIDCLNDMIVAGFWDMTVSIYTSGGHQLQSISVGNDIMTRSILIAELEKELYLLCGLGDGSLLSYKVSRDGSVSEKKKIVIGTKPINLRCFQYVNAPFCWMNNGDSNSLTIFADTEASPTFLPPLIVRQSSIVRAESLCSLI